MFLKLNDVPDAYLKEVTTQPFHVVAVYLMRLSVKANQAKT